MLLDILLALWFVSLFAVGAFAYFSGAKKQLEECMKLRHCDWMSDERWQREADVGQRKWKR